MYNGLPIRYDEIGNPTKIVTNQYWASSSNWEEYGYELEWEGRQLIGRRFYELYSGCDIWYDEYYDLSFEYNADGIRTSKTAYGVEYKYILNGSQIIGETWTEYGTEYLLLYIYDENGSPMGIKYRTEAYAAGVFDYFFFEKNLQGDIVAIYNAEGEKIGSYIYDAWGNFTVSTVSGNTSLENSIVNSYNPFRYRGYYYDKDLGWYYLQSRYYNSQWGRFINADGYVSTGQGLLSYNMFAYCNNNPVMNVDPTGEFPWLVVAIVLVVSSLFLQSCAKQPTSDVGSAQPYVHMEGSDDPQSPNCYAYAIGSPVNEQPGASSGRFPTNWNDVNDVGKSVEADLKAKGYSVRRISGPNAKVYDNEFKIALRVGTKPYYYDWITGRAYYDYHFMRQTDTGQWAEKHGYGGESILWETGMTPDNIPWTLGGYLYYDSDIVYYAVGR